jgi:hypothetical protein
MHAHFHFPDENQEHGDTLDNVRDKLGDTMSHDLDSRLIGWLLSTCMSKMITVWLTKLGLCRVNPDSFALML